MQLNPGDLLNVEALGEAGPASSELTLFLGWMDVEPGFLNLLQDRSGWTFVANRPAWFLNDGVLVRARNWKFRVIERVGDALG